LCLLIYTSGITLAKASKGDMMEMEVTNESVEKVPIESRVEAKS
jgi:hypothetical protein